MTDTSNSYFLVTDFLDLASSRSSDSSSSTEQGSGLSLAQKLVKLHSTPATVPEGYDEPGKPVLHASSIFCLCLPISSAAAIVEKSTRELKLTRYESVRLSSFNMLRRNPSIK